MVTCSPPDQGVRTIRGSDLVDFTSGERYKACFERALIAETPIAARQRLARLYGDVPNSHGGNCPGIAELRKRIRENEAAVTANAFAIVAPHTHWEDQYPIIISADNNNSRYLIGPRSPLPDALYNPVSFCFTGEGPCPYEWVDASVQFDEQDLAACFSCLKKMSKGLNGSTLGLGVSLNFRFKYLTSEEVIGSLEHSAADVPKPFSVIERTDSDYAGEQYVDQVAWLSFDTAGGQRECQDVARLDLEDAARSAAFLNMAFAELERRRTFCDTPT